jgi:hypothetical protein|tara:strand:+ start:303 stop:623 length:321 start_codon:yes stop_codon:yes gene_type:complete
MNETKLVRLVSGEEVLAKIENVDGGVKLTKPYLIIPTQGRGIALMPWCPYSNIQSEGVTLPTDKIMFVSGLAKELENEYLSVTTGIEVPTTGEVAGVIGSQLLTED